LAKAKLASTQDKTSGAEILATVAASAAAPYAVRAQAALALAGLGQPRDLRSRELQLLASGAANVAPAELDRAFFYDARLAAAERTTSREERLRLLSNAVADSPSRTDARVPFFRAAAALERDQLAAASLEQMPEAGLADLARRQMVSGRFEEQKAEEDADAEESDSGEESSAAGRLPAKRVAERAQLAHEVATVMVRLERWQQAQGYLEAAQKLEKSPAERKRISAELAGVRRRVRLQRENAARRPVLHEALEQDRLVRPRLLAAGLAGKTAGKTGGKP
jgi:hypothetical protein